MSTGESSAQARAALARVLIVPGFVVDVYSEIEASFVELASAEERSVEFVWLVPEIASPHAAFADPANRSRMAEPLYVTRLRQRGARIVVGNVAKYDPVANYRLFRDIFRRYRIDAVYTHFGHERFWAIFFGKMFGKVTIWNEHWHSLGTRYTWFKRCFYRLFVDRFIAVSRFIGDSLPNQEKVRTVHNGIAVEGSEAPGMPARAACRSELQLPRDSLVVVMVAAFTAQKRYPLALEVAERVLRARKDVLFVFLGGGAEWQAIARLVEDKKLNVSIRMPGHVANVDQYYRAADVCMFTGHNDAFGYTIVEAMKHGLPVVAFASGGPAEVIRDAETGYLVPEGEVDRFANRLLELLADPALRRQLGAAGRELVRKEYGRSTWVRDMHGVLAEATTGGRAKGGGSGYSVTSK